METFDRYKTVSFSQVRNRKMLNSHLIMSSLEFSYSLCIEYMKAWFLKRFKKDYFGKDYKYVFVDDSHIFGQYKEFKKEDPDVKFLCILDSLGALVPEKLLKDANNDKVASEMRRTF